MTKSHKLIAKDKNMVKKKIDMDQHLYDFWSCLGNFITGVNSVKQQTLIDSLTLLLEIHDCCQGLIHEAAQYLLWWRITDQTKDYKFGMCYFFENHAALKRKSKVWLAQNQNNVYEWGDMSIRGLLFQ
jgi:hypothetical protein